MPIPAYSIGSMSVCFRHEAGLPTPKGQPQVCGYLSFQPFANVLCCPASATFNVQEVVAWHLMNNFDAAKILIFLVKRARISKNMPKTSLFLCLLSSKQQLRLSAACRQAEKRGCMVIMQNVTERLFFVTFCFAGILTFPFLLKRKNITEETWRRGENTCFPGQNVGFCDARGTCWRG